MTQLGEFALWISLLMAAWCVTLAAQGALLGRAPLVTSGTRGLYAAFGFAALAAAGLEAAFIRDDFSLRYVALHSSQNVDPYYKLCAFWAGAEGQWLLVSLAFAAAGSAAALLARRRDGDLIRAAWTVAILGALLAACLAVTGFSRNPFTLFPRAPEDGRGLDPMLRNPAMALQLPLMALGVAAAAVPVALSAAAMLSRRFGTPWFTLLRTWCVVAWVPLAAALLLGAHWAYRSPGLRALGQANALVIASEAAFVAVTVLLAAVGLLRRRRSSGTDAERVRRRAGLVLVVLGATCLVAARAAQPLAKRYYVQIGDGQQYKATDAWRHAWTFTSQGASRLEREGDDVIAVALLPTRDGVRQPFVSSESRQYYGAGGLDIFPAQIVPGIRSTLAQDLVVVLADAGDGQAALGISFLPLVELAWIGGVLMAIGGPLLFWPSHSEN